MQVFLYFIQQWISFAVLNVFFYFQANGQHHIPSSGPVILAGNHTGLLDTPMILSSTHRRIKFLTHEGVFDWPWIGPVVKRSNIITVTPGKEWQAVRACVRHLKAGGVLCIFPEGKLTRSGRLNRFHTGVAKIQELTGAPIIPFAVTGGYEAWPWAKKNPRLFTSVAITYGKALYANAERSLKTQTVSLQETVAQMLTPIQTKAG
ncbi:MAG: 1-acyl-sn-glycerol-3-phosphate acyltransferase [Vampirovibrio sp.]|nr:1-acyl-sn-glycerol-3-phosphate acyltransferase [Vampirovibrio sp.]